VKLNVFAGKNSPEEPVTGAAVMESAVSGESAKSSFRFDVVGLRAMAVLFVMLHHFNIPGFGGAFYGPDIFFVLSGYLITGSLIKEYRTNREFHVKARWSQISFTALYLRRARRILPAAILVIAVTYIYAYFNFNSLRVAQIKSDSLWTLFFGANITFMRQGTDYFASTYVSPLVHFWSLSVTEQFYFIWPALFVAVANARSARGKPGSSNWQRRVVIAFSSILVASFVWMLYTFPNDSLGTYFSTFSRGWELAAGGLICFVNQSSLRERLGSLFTPLRLVALGLMFISFAFVRDTNFAYTMWVPVAATAFLLVSGSANNQDVPYRFLSFKPLRGIGEISYSMYLWHWPIFVFGTEAGLMDQLWQRFVGIGVTILLAIATYFLIEKPFLSIPIKRVVPQSAGSSSPFKGRQIQLASATAAVVGFVVVLGVTYPTVLGLPDLSSENQAQGWIPPVNIATSTRPTQGSATDKTGTQLLTERQALLRKSLDVAVANPAQRKSFERADYRYGPIVPGGLRCDDNDKALVAECDLGSSNAQKLIVVIGSSHAEMWAGAFGQIVVDNPNIRVHFFTTGACPNSLAVVAENFGILGDIKQRVKQCKVMHATALKYIEVNKPDDVVFSSRLGNITPNLSKDYLLGAKAFIAAASVHAKQVSFIGETPVYRDPHVCFNRKLSNIQSCGARTLDNILAMRLQSTLLSMVKVNFIDPTPWFCIEGVCPSFIGNISAAAIDDHISQEVAISVSPLLYNALFGKK